MPFTGPGICLLVVASCAALAGGCAAGRPVPPVQLSAEIPGTVACERFYAILDDRVASAGVGDGAGAAIAGAPWLRSSRWLAAGARLLQPYEDWVAALREREVEARLSEVINLPAATRQELAAAGPGPDLASAILTCSETLAAATIAAGGAREPLHEGAAVADEYISWHRWAGLYPLTRFAIQVGVRVWQNRVEAEFRNTIAGDPWPARYVPAADARLPAAGPDGRLFRLPRDGLDRLDSEHMITGLLFAAYAPVIEMESGQPWNLPGTPFWEAPQRPNVLTGAPRLYTFLDHVDFHGAVLPRLNYVVWFSSRPKRHVLDLLGGRLDGMTIRMTLDSRGQPLHLETMHNCGCFHQHYLLGDAAARPDHGYAERPLVLAGPQLPGPGERWLFRLQDRSHYVAAIGVTAATETGTPYALSAYSELAALRDGDGGYRSLFRPDGLIAGTSRDERVLFWVSGIPDPGAMRRHGRHATAFVGRRHFDDPDLLERVIIPDRMP